MKTSRSSTHHHTEHGKARLCITAFCLLLFPFTVFAANTQYSIDGHTIKKNGRPVFFVGDTVWTAGVRFNDEEMESYLNDAKSKGFNFIGVFGTPGWAFRNGGNRNGDPPFNEANPASLNQDYWSRHGTLIAKAKSKGITVFFCVGHPLDLKQANAVWVLVGRSAKIFGAGSCRRPVAA